MAFDLSAPDWQVFAGLGSRLQAQIAESPEYMALPNKPRTIAVGTPARPPAPAAMPEPPAYASDFAPDSADSDIPF